MPFLGYTPDNTFHTLSKQTITGDGGTSYTLTNPVVGSNDIEVFVNNVRQEPSVAYTASDTSIVFTSAVQSSDDVYVIYQGKALGLNTVPDNTISTGKIIDNAVTQAKIATGAVDTTEIADGAISTGKIVDGAITQAKIDPNVSLGGGLFKGDNGTIGTQSDDIFRVNTQSLNANVTIANTENASATGPVTVANGVTLTVQSGGTLRII
jgi:hypothetical protein